MEGVPLASPHLSSPPALAGVLPGSDSGLRAAVCHSHSAETDGDCGRWAGAETLTPSRQAQALVSLSPSHCLSIALSFCPSLSCPQLPSLLSFLVSPYLAFLALSPLSLSLFGKNPVSATSQAGRRLPVRIPLLKLKPPSTLLSSPPQKKQNSSSYPFYPQSQTRVSSSEERATSRGAAERTSPPKTC